MASPFLGTKDNIFNKDCSLKQMLVIPGIPPDNFWICFNMCCSILHGNWVVKKDSFHKYHVSSWFPNKARQGSLWPNYDPLWPITTYMHLLGPKYDSLWPKPEHPMSKLRFYVTLRKNHDFLWPNHGSLRKFPEISKDACFHLHNQAIGVTSGQW